MDYKDHPDSRIFCVFKQDGREGGKLQTSEDDQAAHFTKNRQPFFLKRTENIDLFCLFIPFLLFEVFFCGVLFILTL